MLYGEYAGLGDTASFQQTQKIANMATMGATTTVGILAGMHAAIGGIAMAGPVGAAIAGILALTPVIINLFKGCGETCELTTKIVNDAEPILQQNVNAYLNSPVRYRSMQLAALNNFDTVWNAIKQACGNPAYQQAGQRCVTDRQSGACAIKTAQGECWNWFIGYRDPIANDPGVLPDPDPSQATLQQNTDGSYTVVPTAASSLPTPLLLGGAALVLFLLMGSSK